MNKQILIGGVVLLVVIGGIFLYLAKPSSPEDGYSTTPTQWSQAGDYKIEETPEGTVVTNEPAGFSFRIPSGWSVEGDESTPHIVNALSPDIEFDENKSIIGGCGIFTAILYQEDEFDYLNRLIQRVSSRSAESQDSQDNEEVIEITGHQALKTSVFAADSQQLVRGILIEIPFGENGIANIETNFLPSHTECLEKFDGVLATISF